MLEAEGALRYEACGFDFEQAYGELGHGFAKCHHLVPIAEFETGSKTRVMDLAILCANCHRVVHRRGGLPVEDLSTYIKGRGAT